MHVRSLVLLAALWASPLAAQESMRLDLGATPPAAEDATSAPAVAQAENPPAPNPEPAPTSAAKAVSPPADRPAGIGVAQATGGAGGADDKDHIIACSIIYQRIADMYRERGETEKADTFLSTAYAYSQASDILYTQEVGAEGAYDAISQRMSVVSESLNREAQGYPNGDLGVVNGWLGWCDERGAFVQTTMDSFKAAQEAENAAAQ